MNKRLIVVFLLGFSSGLPFVLLSSTLQAWYVDAGFSLKMTAVLGLLGLPYLFKLLFALFVDQYALPFLGQRRGWMAATQVSLWIGFNSFAWCQPHEGSSALFILAFCLSICSAVQDVVVDAQRIEYLPIEEHGLGAALSMFGYRLALLLGGGVALILAHDFGWVWVYRVMGFGMGFGLFATLWSREPVVVKRQWTAWWAPFQELFMRRDMVYVLLFILFYKAGEAFTSGSSWIVIPFFRMGLGVSLKTIGYVNQMMGLAAVLIGGLAAGLVLRFYPLFNALLCFGLFQAIANILFIALAVKGGAFPLLATAVFTDNLAVGMGSTALVAFLMRIVNRQFTATQFSLLVAVSLLPRFFSSLIAEPLQTSFGWVGLYEAAFVLSLVFIPLLYKVRRYCWPLNADPLTGASESPH